MRPAKDLHNKQIVSVSDGRILGRVREVYFDSDVRHLTGLHVGYEGLIDRTARIIPREAIKFLGADVVLVTDSAVVREEAASDAANWLRRDKVAGRELVTEGDTRVGTIADVILGNEAEVEGFSLDKTYIEGPVAESGAVSRGVVVDLGSEDRPAVINLQQAEQERYSFG